MSDLKQLVREEYIYMDAKSRLQQIEKTIEHGPHSFDLVFEKDSREGVLAVSEAGFDSGSVTVRLEGRDGISVQDDGTPLSDVVRESLSRNGMLSEGRVTPKSAIHYFGEGEQDEEQLDEDQILSALDRT